MIQHKTPKTPLSPQEIKNLQINILDAFVAFCKEHNLKYFLCAGTLLGAIRHKGYIPWDDDIDLMMERGDYQYVIENFSHPNLTLFHYSTHRNFNVPFIKISDNHTKITEFEISWVKDLGVNIDIFPIDRISRSEAVQQQLCRRHKLWTFRILPKFTYFTTNFFLTRKNPFKLALGVLIYPFFRAFEKVVSLRYCMRRIDTLSAEWLDQVDTVPVRHVWCYGSCEIFEAGVFDDVFDVEFEGKKYASPADYDGYLRTVFGDYMVLPPVEKRVSHGLAATWR